MRIAPDPLEQGLPQVLVSACLLGAPVRYDGGHRHSAHAVLARWRALGCVHGLCPETAGGLPTPRPAAEIMLSPGNGRQSSAGAQVLAGLAQVRDSLGRDVSAAFIAGAQQALAAVQAHGIAMAVLKQDSPSCASLRIYDGQFSGQRVDGEGVTTALLRAHGVQVFGEDQWPQAWACWQGLGAQPGHLPS